MVRQLELPALVNRNAPPPTLYPFTRFFHGFEKVPAARKIFGRSTDDVLANLKVEFCTTRFGYMAVDHKDAHLIVSTWHLKNSDFQTLYLDVIHELFHIGQFRQDRESFIDGYVRLVRDPAAYFKNHIEIAAYDCTVKEARRIGLSTQEIIEYLKVPWASAKSFETFLRKVGIDRLRKQKEKVADLSVHIQRNAPITLRPFTDYFKGFEDVPGIRRLFGENSEQVLGKLKVEFDSHPLNYLRMNDDDGHLEISLWHLNDSDISVLYLDIYLYLQFVSQFLLGRYDAMSLFNNSSIKNEDPAVQDYAAELIGFRDFNDYKRTSKLRSSTFLDAPMAIEAYRATIAEARRIGMSERELADYVYIPTGAMTRSAYQRLMTNLSIDQPARKSSPKRSG